MDVIPSRDERLREQRLKLPDEPGVYMFRNVGGDVIYVGKANSIRKRVASHFNRPSGRRGTEMVAAIDQIESVVVGSGTEALIAEQAFIKTHRPRFNVLLRDDKSYPFIGISTDEKFIPEDLHNARAAAPRSPLLRSLYKSTTGPSDAGCPRQGIHVSFLRRA